MSVLEALTYVEDSIHTFVDNWNLEKEFKKMTGKDIEDYDHDQCDDELIIKLLNKYYPKVNYIVDFREREEDIIIYEITKRKRK